MLDKSLARRLTLLFGSLLAAFGIAELALRCYAGSIAPRRWVVEYSRSWDRVPREFFRYVSHPHFSHVPNPAFRSEDGKDRHNRFGFRGREIEAEKPEGVVRVFCMGGSTTYTTSVDDYTESYPSQLERTLRGKYGREDVEVVNAGVPGFASLDSLLYLQLRVLPLDPDLIVIYHGINDVATRLVPHEEYRPDNTGYRSDWSLQTRETPRRWWHHSRLAYCLGVRTGIIAPHRVGYGLFPDTRRISVEKLRWNPPVYYETNLDKMILLSRDAGADIMLSTWAHSEDFNDPILTAGVRENNDVVRRVGKRSGVPVLDFAGVMPGESKLWSDGIHVNAPGAARKAEIFAAFIEEHFLSRND